MDFSSTQPLSVGVANNFEGMTADAEMQDLSHSGIYGGENGFETLPLQLLDEIFKYLSVSDRNKVRKVAYSWDRAIRLAFGVKIILNNHNVQDMAQSSDIVNIQVRNLTTRLPQSPVFSHSDSVQTLEVIGMILSGSLIQLCTEFRYLCDLKLNRIYLETDRQVPINPVDEVLFPKGISNLTMRFLRTIHKHSGFSLGRNNDLYALTASDNIVLNILTKFQFPKLVNFQFYHAMEEDIEAERNSDMINRARSLELDTETESSRIMSSFIQKAWLGHTLKKIKVDNIPKLVLNTDNLPTNPLFQLSHLEVKGIMEGHWVSLLDSQTQLKRLKLVLLSPDIIQNVKNAVRRNAATLEEISLVIATPNDMLLNEDTPAESNGFDIMFITDCRNLINLKLQNAPKIIDVSFLPLSLKSLSICGNIRGIFDYLSMATDLRHLTLDICDGPICRDLPPEKPLFSQLPILQALIRDTNICKIHVSEMGAKQDYKDFVLLCEKMDFIQANLSTIEYKITFPEQDDIGRQGFVNVPRIKIKMGEQFSRRCEFGALH